MPTPDPAISNAALDQQRRSHAEQFLWPPSRVSSAAAATPPIGSKTDAAPLRDDTLPSQHASEPADSPAPQATPAARSSSRLQRFALAIRQIIHDAERIWLDVQCPVLHERLRDLGWCPDTTSDYCHRCGQTLPPAADANRMCTQCEGKRLPWRRIVRLGPYRPPLTRLVHEVKFTRWRRLGADLGDLLGESLAAAVAEERAKRPDFPARIIVIPVPTTFRRRMYRGVDHTAILARRVSRRLNARFTTRVLTRKHRPSQLAVLPSERTANIGKSIRRRRKGGANLQGTLVVVVDDVTTTGATLRAACRGVAAAHRAFAGERRGGFEVWGAVLAVTELEPSKSGMNGKGPANRPGKEAEGRTNGEERA